jgi:hypothetical protein
LDDERRAAGPYPTPDCLNPSELELAARDFDKLQPEDHAHLEECSACAALVAVSLPDLSRFEEHLQLIRFFAGGQSNAPVEALSTSDWEESMRPLAALNDDR